MSSGSPGDSLLRHGEALRSLARALLRDEHEVDEALQETWLAALRRPPALDRDVRPWLARVLRNAVGQRRRGAANRAARERDAARPERVVAAPDETLIEIERQQLLLDRLAELPKEQREALVERFLRGRGPSDAAERLGVPLETFRTRVRRGLATLRSRLDEDFEDRSAWVAWLVPLARGPLGGAPSSLPTSEGTGSAAASSVGLPVTVLPATGFLMKKILVVAAVLLALPALWLAGDAVVDAIVHDDARATPLSPDDPVVAARSEGEPDDDPRALATPGTDGSGRESLSGDTAAEETPVRGLELELVGLRADGTEVRGLDGRLAWEAHAVEVSGGRASVEPNALPADAGELALVLGEWPAALTEASVAALLAAREPGVLVLEAVLLLPVELRVVDALSGADLADVEVLGDWYKTKRDVAPQGVGSWPDSRRIAGASPIELTPRRRIEGYWVSAPDHEWTHVVVDHADGGRREVRLGAGGDIAVQVVPVPAPERRVRLRLYRTPDAPPIEAVGAWALPAPGEDPDAPIVLGRVPPGAWTLRAETGMWYDPPVVLAQADVVVHAGERTPLVLALDAAFAAPPTTLRGELSLPQERSAPARLRAIARGSALQWVRGEASLAVHELEPAGRDRFAFEYTLSPGLWELHVAPYEVSVLVDVPEEGAAGVRVDVPELVDVTARFTDRATGAPLPLERIAFTTAARNGLLRGGDVSVGMMALESVHAEPEEPGVFRFAAPAGSLSVDASLPEYEDAAHTIDARPPATEVSFALERVLGFRLRLVHDGATVPWPWGLPIEVRRVDATGGGRVREVTDGRATVRVDAPGLFEVRVGPIEGYATPEPVEVHVRAGEEREVTVELRR